MSGLCLTVFIALHLGLCLTGCIAVFFGMFMENS